MDLRNELTTIEHGDEQGRDRARLTELARGPLSAWLLRRLAGRPTVASLPAFEGDALVDDDLHLALHLVSDLEYRPRRGVRRDAAADPLVVAFRTALEDAFLDAVVRDVEADDAERHRCTAELFGPRVAVEAMLDAFDGPSLSTYVDDHADRGRFREFLIHRSAYQLKEADPHTIGLARLSPGPRKSAYAEIQFDEYGNGEPGCSHAELFAAAMQAAGLDPTYGRYVSMLPGATLATGNLLSLFAGRAELLAPLVGHLALFEMTSVGPMGRYAHAARRLTLGPAVERFYDVHVVADEHHGDLARRILLGDGGPVDDLDPAGLVFGAHALLRVEDRFARHVLDAWAAGRSSLLG